MHLNYFYKSLFSLAAIILATFSTGCSIVHDDISECPADLKLRFVYDYNLKFADAFPHEVTSVYVWAFDKKGNCVWSKSETSDILKIPGYEMEVDLPEGTYDFIAWCGLHNNNQFDLTSYHPASIHELSTTLKTIESDSRQNCSKLLPGLYHGMALNQKYEIDHSVPTHKIIPISLVKDTNDIRIMLQHLDGSEIENRDFTVTLTYNNSVLDWDNSIIYQPGEVTYRPWNIRYGVTDSPMNTESDSRAITTVASLLFDMSTSRLMAEDKAILTIHRNWDNRDIIKVNLIQFLLLARGFYGNISDQEYLDRQDDYSALFLLDPQCNWHVADGIFINGWAVVPPQDSLLE